MELGGNAPLIVCPDADLPRAVDETMKAKLRNNGEACTAANVLYVHEAVVEAFTKHSGYGREGGVEGIHEYLETKYLCLDASE